MTSHLYGWISVGNYNDLPPAIDRGKKQILKRKQAFLHEIKTTSVLILLAFL